MCIEYASQCVNINLILYEIVFIYKRKFSHIFFNKVTVADTYTCQMRAFILNGCRLKRPIGMEMEKEKHQQYAPARMSPKYFSFNKSKQTVCSTEFVFGTVESVVCSSRGTALAFNLNESTKWMNLRFIPRMKSTAFIYIYLATCLRFNFNME